MKAYHWTVVMMALTVAAGWMGCEKLRPLKPEELIVGRWEEKETDSYMEFRADKTVTMGGKALGLSLGVSGTYAFLEPNKVKIELRGLSSLAGPQILILEFPARDQMTTRNETTGTTRHYTRVPAP